MWTPGRGKRSFSDQEGEGQERQMSAECSNASSSEHSGSADSAVDDAVLAEMLSKKRVRYTSDP